MRETIDERAERQWLAIADAVDFCKFLFEKEMDARLALKEAEAYRDNLPADTKPPARMFKPGGRFYKDV